MANQMSKTMAMVAASGMILGLAACGGSTPPADSAATPGTEATGEKKSCSGAKGCSGAKTDAPPADGAATPTPPPADAPK
jgi:hypothetical protein